MTAANPLSANAAAGTPIDSPPLHGVWLAVLTGALLLATFIEVLDSTVTNVAVPSLAGNLGVSHAQATWVISSYAVSAAIAVPLTGWLAGRLGEARLFMAAICLFYAHVDAVRPVAPHRKPGGLPCAAGFLLRADGAAVADHSAACSRRGTARLRCRCGA